MTQPDQVATVTVEGATEVDAALLEAAARLLPQLSSSAPVPGPSELAEIVASPATTLLVARTRSGGERDRRAWPVVGLLTLVLFRIPTGVRAWIEDVVVDEEARGRGVGAALTHEAVARARNAGARTVDLTSRPSREAANRLYRRLGFVERESNLYRLDLG